MFYVYILWSDTKHYIWVTNDLGRRIEEHKRWQNKTTSKLLNVFLIWHFEKQTKSEAMKLEKIIKKNGHIQHWITHNTFIHADVA
jgi:predicted GIY-YIG superfamily endonuclease